MRVLLDTNVLLRTLAGDPAVESIRDILLADETEVYVSAVSWWDIAARIEAGRLKADLAELREASAASGFIELPLRGEHIGALAGLAASGAKAPSFDLVLAAQAEVEPLRLISSDTRFAVRSSLFLRV
ncbi:MAG: PIN domain-containing protein [Desulfovibrio sp.]|jgi:PIN domain nuclease of toxin-antitoxin system|nr:PIN domain-containing protein [Desulfovibrio sp.]